VSEALHRPRTLPNPRLAITQSIVYFGALTDIGESFESLTRFTLSPLHPETGNGGCH
jgi:hypothetical protein